MLLQLSFLQLLLKRLGLVLILYTICRVIFYALNRQIFPDLPIGEGLTFILVGVRFDIVSVIYCNLLFITLHLVPHPYRTRKGYEAFLKYLFLVTNGIALAFMVIDLEYYKYTLKRTTSDIFDIRGDILELLPQYLAGYWYFVVLFILFLAALGWVYQKIRVTHPEKINYRIQVPLLVIGAVFALIGMRGGIQVKPITPINAGHYTESSKSALVTNTPFTILHSFSKQSLSELRYLPEADRIRLFDASYSLRPDGPPKTDNIVIILLESFAREFVGYLNDRPLTYTPFLDSLAGHSLTFTQAFANGKTSIDAVMAITTGIPHLMEEPFMFSRYQHNQFSGLGAYLKPRGYHTSFFHGAYNGSFSFDDFTYSAGFDHYFGKDEYGNDADFDGNWGIFDEPFFQFTAEKLHTFPEPFCAMLFSLSSHQPFTIPPRYRTTFDEGAIPIHKTIRYTDHALRQFFNKASKMPWYGRTLFVITADHTSQVELPSSYNRIGMYGIPMLLFHPDGHLAGSSTDVVQHVDLLPSILDYLNIEIDLVSFGRSVFDPKAGSEAVNYINSIYQLQDDRYLILFDGERVSGLYDYRKDPDLKNNISAREIDKNRELSTRLKAILQTYHYRMIHNKLSQP